jgi:hypothetical protein
LWPLHDRQDRPEAHVAAEQRQTAHRGDHALPPARRSNCCYGSCTTTAHSLAECPLVCSLLLHAAFAHKHLCLAREQRHPPASGLWACTYWSLEAGGESLSRSSRRRENCEFSIINSTYCAYPNSHPVL